MNDQVKSYFEKLVALIPVEVVAAYEALQIYSSSQGAAGENLIKFALPILSLGVVGYQWKFYKNKNSIAIGASVVSFIIFAAVTTIWHPWFDATSINPTYLTGAMILWVFIVPLLLPISVLAKDKTAADPQINKVT